MALRRLGNLILACTLSISIAVGADVPGASTAREIAHLLSYLEASGCEFYRNGGWHSAKEARGHLEKKYRYLEARSLIGSAEDFIDKAASSSSMSGDPYLVRCERNATLPTRVWLRSELERFRSGADH